MHHVSIRRGFVTTLLLVMVATQAALFFVANPRVAHAASFTSYFDAVSALFGIDKARDAWSRVFGSAAVSNQVAQVTSTGINRRLATDCTYDTAFTPSEANPFDLDWCTIDDRDEITLLLTDIRAKWPGGFYVRAPSKTLVVKASYTSWPSATKNYVFLEDQSPSNQFTIEQIPVSSSCTGSACEGFWKLWHFENFTKVKIGGPNLSLTFIGTHPGFANCTQHAYYANQVGVQPEQIPNCDINKGLLNLEVTDGSTPTLADIRTNVRYSQMYAIYLRGFPGYYEGSSANHIQTCNFAGVMYATAGVFIHDSACRDVWVDPDHTVLTDPYVRVSGWQGQVLSSTVEGRPFACADGDEDQVRASSFGAYYSSTLKGGYTLEYGNYNFGQRLMQRVGTGVNDPLIVKLQDVGLTGPIEKPCPGGFTCAAGARARFFGDLNYWKGDPHDTPDLGGTPLRFMRIVTLPPHYGNGLTLKGRTGCADTRNDNDGGSDEGNFLRFEANVIGPSNSTRDWVVEFAGDWRRVSEGGSWNRTPNDLVAFGFYDDDGLSYRNTVRLADGTNLSDTITLRDTSTVTGPGTFNNLATGPGYGTSVCRANVIKDTNVKGSITISGSCGTTNISNVNFTGSARRIVQVGAGSNAVISALCAPTGSTIEGSGTVTYNGAPITLPYTLPVTSNCTTGGTPPPPPPPTPTASLNVSPTSVPSGSSTTLTWGSTQATTCVGTGFSTGNAVSGSLTVTPAQTTTYTVTCSNASGNASAFATVTVTSSNVAPVVTNPGSKNSTVGVAVSLQIVATDSNGDVLTYSATGLPAGLSIGSGTGLITGTPTTAQTKSVTVTADDSRGGQATATFNWTVANPTEPGSGTSVWDDTVIPSTASAQDTGSVELGVRFRSNVDGYITGVRFYKGVANTGIHVGKLWSSTGVQLATATFTNETATGWQQVLFSAPVPITANTVYVASYHAPNGGYSYNRQYFATGGVTSGPLYLYRDGESGGNGVFEYGSGTTFPNNSYESSNYWVDVVFANLVTDTTPPTTSNVQTTNVTQNSVTVTWTTNEPATSQVAYGTTVAYGATTPETSVLATSHAVVLTGLAAGTTYHMSARSRDAAGNSAASADTVVTTLAAPDTTSPNVSITAPLSGSTQTGVISVTALANDPTVSGQTTSGVAGIRFFVDGTSLGNEDTTSPYTIGLDTTTLTNDTHTISATARDGAGNTSSASITITVANPVVPPIDTTPPVISNVIAANAGGANTITYNVTWTTNEPSTGKVVYGRSLSNLGSSVEHSTLTTSHALSLANLANKTTYYYRVSSTDASGNTSSSAVLSFKTGGKPPRVTNLTAQSGSVVLSWDKVPDADSIIIIRSAGGKIGAPTDRALARLNGSAITYKDTTAQNNTLYTYTLYVKKNREYSDPSTVTFKKTTTRPTLTETQPKPTLSLPTQPPMVTPTRVTLSRALGVGMIGDDVKLLQQALNARGYTVATTGDGSQGNETTYFGVATLTALKRFQCAELNICSGTPTTTGYGQTGPKTREVLGQ